MDTCERIQHDFFISRGYLTFLEGWDFLWFMGSLPVVFGHIGAVMLVYQSDAIPWLTRRLAALGRMALSNYLLDSIVFTTIFEGYGLGLVFVLAMWAFKLWFSPLWLGTFLYGPAEWLWRSLTYWKSLPMRPSFREGGWPGLPWAEGTNHCASRDPPLPPLPKGGKYWGLYFHFSHDNSRLPAP